MDEITSTPVESSAGEVSESNDSSFEGLESQEVVDEGQGNGSSEDFSGDNSGTQEDLEAKIQEAKDNGASNAEIKKMIKEFDLVVNGKTVKSKIDLSDEAAIKRELQKAYAFTEVSQEYSQFKKALQAKVEAWKKNPELAIQELGFDPEEVATKTLEKRLERAKMTPEQIENERIKKELQEYKEREERIKQQLLAQEEARKDQEAMAALESEIEDALSKTGVLQPNQYTKRRVADLMAYYSDIKDENGNRKYPNVTAEQVIPVLEREIEKEFSTILENVPETAIERFLSKKVLERIAPKPAPKPTPKKSVPASPTAVKNAASSASVEAKKEPEKKRTFEDVMNIRKW